MSFRGNLIRRGLNLTFSEAVLSVPLCKYQPTHAAMTTTATITVANLLKGIIIGVHSAGATQTYTMPTGADLDAGLTNGFVVNSSFDFTIINVSAAIADTITLGVSAGIATILGQATIDSEDATSEFPNSGTFRVRKTAADTFIVYRL